MKLAQIQVDMENGSILSLSSIIIFKLCHFKAFDNYATLHNLGTCIHT